MTPTVIHTLADIIQSVSTPRPALLPLFRSEHQLRLLGELFVRDTEARSIAELSTATGIPQATVSREVARLEDAGIVRSSQRGRLRLVEADDRAPWYWELRALLLTTVGPAAVVADVLAGVEGIERAYLFGSWAARHLGIPGVPPNDLDLLVVGSPDLDELYAACRQAERELRLDVNPVVRTPAEWDDEEDDFLRNVRSGPLVPVKEGR